MQNQGSTSVSSSALHSFTSGPLEDPDEDDYEGQANVEREAYEGNTLDPHNLDGIGGP